MPFFKPLRDIIKRTQELNIDLVMRSLFDQEEDLKDLIIKLNTQDQLFEQGIDSQSVTLESIGGKYSDVTISFKQTDNLPFDRITLFDTGAFYESFSVTYEMGGIVINADTIKETGDLRERWGNDILGLTDESLAKLVFFIQPLMVEFIIEYITQDL